ncbi:hypothetical protein P7C71_g1313, partial [Lecanoromycetidae sp. Uapishka_2]
MAPPNRAIALRANRVLPEADFLKALHAAGKYKERSEKTHNQVHAPCLSGPPSGKIRYLLLGDSMLERFQTTGKETWLGSMQFPKLFNAGVGGDKTQNVVYRLGTKNLYSGLQERGFEVAILHMGTNKLTPKRSLTAEVIENYALVLEALRRIAPEAVMLVTAIHHRKDVNEALVDQSNADLRQLVADFNEVGDDALVHFVPASLNITLDRLVDHAHLDEAAYNIFAQTLLQKLKELGLEV